MGLELNFQDAIDVLGGRARMFQIANAARPMGDYLFNSFLPERAMLTYDVRSGTMTVRPTMAGMSGMDSPYAPGGMVELSDFMANTAKITNEVTLTEATLRALQTLVQNVMTNGGSVAKTLATEVLNFFDKIIVQAHLDCFEWMRGQVLSSGQLNWTYNKKSLAIDYGVPSGNILTPRTGTDSYDSTASKFWTDIVAGQQLLNYAVAAIIAHPTTINKIISNPANSLQVLDDANGMFKLQRFQNINSLNMPSTDRRDIVTLISYGLEGEVMDPAATNRTQKIPFMPVGKIVMIGQNSSNPAWKVGQGATDDAINSLELGYTHLGPTVEGGAPGRWGDVFTPEREQWQLVGRGVTNGLPVLEAPHKLVILETDLS